LIQRNEGRILAAHPRRTDIAGGFFMSADWIYVIAVASGVGAFSVLLFFMTIYAPGPKR